MIVDPDCTHTNDPGHECRNRNGNPLSGGQSCWVTAREALILEALHNFIVADNGCWVWQGVVSRSGYGIYGSRPAHRALYERLRHVVPPELQMDHLCRNRACVNPDHLEPVTCKENLHRGEPIWKLAAQKTHCHVGHPFSESNTYVTKEGLRMCRRCHADRQNRYRFQSSSCPKGHPYDAVGKDGRRYCSLCRHAPKPQKVSK